MKSNKGFTLIELLVVIAIIGILSSVVLASLNTARTRGADAAAQANLNNARAQAELYYDGQSPVTYAGVCDQTGGILSLVTAAGEAVTGSSDCDDSATAWRASVVISSGVYCVDSEGSSTVLSGAAHPTSTSCN